MPETQPPEDQLSTTEIDDQPGNEEPGAAEYGGPRGMEPTRYGDWEKNGRCIDF